MLQRKDEGWLSQQIKEDEQILKWLYAIRSLNLQDCWLCAGAIRSAVWDWIYYGERKDHHDDLDVIFYDLSNVAPQFEKQLEKELRQLIPNQPWSVKNQARMHEKHSDIPQYKNSIDAMSKFPETATAIGVRLNALGQIEIATPHGLSDLFNGVVRPTPFFTESSVRMQVYEQRMKSKNWVSKWPDLTIESKC